MTEENGTNLTEWPRYGLRVRLDPLTPTEARDAAETFGEALLAHHPLAYTDGELRTFVLAWLELHRARGAPVPWPLHLMVRQLEPDRPPDRAEVLVAYLHELVGALPPGLQAGAMGAVIEVLTTVHTAAGAVPPPFLSLARYRYGPRHPSPSNPETP